VEVCPWNLLEQSNAFSTSPWSLTRATLTSGQSGYDGLTNAWKYTEGTFTANLPVLEQSFTSSSDVETYSFYLKAGTRNWVAISVQGTGYIWINLTDGTVGSAGGGTPPTATTQLVGNGWYLVSVSSTGTKFGINLHITDANNSTSYNGNGTGFVYVQNAQRNIGSTAKPYFPTTDRLNVPRLTYQNGGGGCPSLLLEKQSTNLVTYSEQLDNAAWTKVRSTITANDTTSPDGTQNADKITLDSSTNLKFLEQTQLQNGTYTQSVYAKAGTHNFLQLLVGSDATPYCNFDLVNGTYSASGCTASITSVGNGWFRCVMTYSTTIGDVVYLLAVNSLSSSRASSTSSTGYYYIWGFQLELSSYPTSYIPTTSASATRVADDITNTFLQSGGFLGSNKGAMFVSGIPYSLLGNVVCNFVLTADNNTTKAFLFDTSSNQIRIRTWDASSNMQSLTSGTITGNYKLCVSWTSSSIKFFVNGSLIGTISQTIYPYTTIKPESTSYSNNIWSQLTFFTNNLADADAIALTTL
jgi:hypothetical protein